MTALIWPAYIAPNSIDWWLDTPTRSGGQSILGNERIVATPAARWRATMGFRIWGKSDDPQRLLIWRAFMSRMGGRAGSVQIGPFDILTPARLAGATSSAIPPYASVLGPMATPTTFGDMATIDDVPTVYSSGFGNLAAAAAAGARSITISYGGIGTPVAGQYFGIGGAALYLADSVTWNGDGTATLGFSPGLRAAAASGTEVDFEKPRCTMRLFADDGARAKTGVDWMADTTLDLVEVF